MSSKIFISIVGSLFLGLFLSVLVFQQAKQGNDTTVEVTGKAFKALEQSQALRKNFLIIDELDQRVLAMSSFVTRQEIASIFNPAKQQFIKAMGGIRQNVLSPNMAKLINKLETAQDIWLKDAEILLGLKPSLFIPTAEKYNRSKKNLATLINEMKTLATNDATWISKKAQADVSSSLFTTYFIAMLVAIAGSLAAYLLARGLSKPLVNLVATAEQLVTGDTSVKFSQADRKDEIGAVVRAVANFRDGIIHKLSLQEQLADQAEALQEALAQEKHLNKLQREFVSMASHEFRTPLAIIDSSARRLEKRKDRLTPQDIETRTDKIRNAVSRMMTLVESTLDAAKADNGKLSISPKDTKFKDLVDHICERQDDLYTTHNISYETQDLPLNMYVDSGVIDQVLTNLLSNAVKYAPDCPDILLKGWQEEDQVFISVQDFGLGIDEADLPKMFGRFFRAKTSTGIPGTGIGLNLVNQLVELHGGKIDLESQAGVGSTFTVCLPIEGAQIQEPPEEKVA